VNWTDWHRKTLEVQVSRLSTLDKRSAKKFVRDIRDRKPTEVCLSDAVNPFDAERFRAVLESLGAVATAESRSIEAP
jgi:DNA invertase Pin-like site-specific DNA recombinase